ncbi:hypothetical protein O1504_13560 [Bacteroides fragilis]|uniref:hypothetical protein n=1 Tax=Bacteroides fragilis TaxID=817 RepID=UPI0022AADC19|nr:hypothetical protein [Bacteroides fragilis]MCZ2590825.1 hypothetical protein [Bacteroides fragilis]
MKQFQLTINEELAGLLRSATELNSLLNSYVQEHFKGLDYQDWQEYPAKQFGEMQNTTLDIMSDLSDIIGYDIAQQVHAELKKEDKV